MKFKVLGQTVAEYIKNRAEFYSVDVDTNKLVELYREGFPEGENPIFKWRRYYDCSTCFHFIRNMGAVVDENGKSIFRAPVPYPFNEVFEKLADFVELHDVVEPFLTDQPNAGKVVTILDTPLLGYDKFYHFYYDIEGDARMFDREAPSTLSDIRGRMTSLKNALQVSDEPIETALEYINDGIYRGEAYKGMVESLKTAKAEYEASGNQPLWLAMNYGIPASRLKGSAVWILLGEVDKGTSLQDAERLYLKAVDPINYMRVSTIASEEQTKKALKFLTDGGYKESIFRRHATYADIEHHKVWEERGSAYIGDDVDELFGQLPTKKSQPITKSGGEEISLATALELAKNANTVEVSVTNSNKKHIAIPSVPKFEDSKPIYHWDCGFGWTYRDGLSDVSNITQAVKSAGGNIKAAYRISLAWFANDDLDIHLETPSNKVHFQNRRSAGWELDVDMNAVGVDNGTNPIENIFTESPQDGKYEVKVNQYSKRREHVREDFYIEVVMPDCVKTIHYPSRLASKKTVSMATFEIEDGKVVNFKTPYSIVNEEVETKWCDVKAILETPKESALHHTFFVLDGYKYESDEKVRGLFIDAMKPELREHRKVLELVGDKTAFDVEDNGAIMFGIADNKENLGTPIKIGGKPYVITNSKA